MLSKGLRHTLERAGLQQLVEALDWNTQPRRSLARLFLYDLIFRLYMIALFGALFGAFVAGQFIHYQYVPDPSDNALFAIVIWLPLQIAVGLPIVLLGPIVRQLRWDHLARFPERALFSSRKPVLYLRRFSEENPVMWDQKSNLYVRMFRVDPGAGGFERVLQRAFSRVGPLICLGDPRQQRKGGSAPRLYARDETWQPAVEALAKLSGPVFIDYIEGGSVDWELERFLNERNRVVVLLVRKWPSYEAYAGNRLIHYLQAAYKSRFLEAGLDVNRLRRPGEGNALLLSVGNGKVDISSTKLTSIELERQIRSALTALRVTRSAPTIRRPGTAIAIQLVERLPLALIVLAFASAAVAYLSWFF